jgi:hypothetical protein
MNNPINLLRTHREKRSIQWNKEASIFRSRNLCYSAEAANCAKKRWEATSKRSACLNVGVGKLSTLDELIYNSQEYWGAFVLLYEMLEEYGTHLVEAAWNHQVYNHAKITSFVFCIFFLTEQTWYIIYEMCVCVAL